MGVKVIFIGEAIAEVGVAGTTVWVAGGGNVAVGRFGAGCVAAFWINKACP